MAFYEMTKHENGAIADEMRANLEWAFKELPQPGQDEKDIKADREAKEKGDEAQQEADGAEADGLPAPDAEPDTGPKTAGPGAGAPAGGPPEQEDDLPSPTAP